MNWKNFSFLLAALVFLIVVLITPLNKISRLGSVHLGTPPANFELSAEEINSFMEVWADFMQKGLADSMKQVSLNSDGSVPPRVVRWLNAKGWSAEYFFAVEQRLRGLVSIATLQNNLEDNQKLYEKNANDNLRRIIKNQKEQFAALRYNPQELALVRANIYQIVNVLNGSAVVK